MKFKGFTLDPFQEESIKCIDRGNSVVVSAATGTGKTLIADYIIDKYLKLGKKIIYTAPIKALSNQKYRDFKEDYGYGAIGLLTGDVVINPEGSVLIMTTEIYRNMLLSNDPLVDEVSYVIFDEIHFINDIERGTVWEESIIFSPDNIRFLCLSATIPNAKEFASWIESIKNHKIEVVKYDKRAVPLDHYFFDKFLGVIPRDEMEQRIGEPVRLPKQKKGRRKRNKIPAPFPEELVSNIQNKLPCLFFVFSRKECEKKAGFVARKFKFLKRTEKAEVAKVISSTIPKEYSAMTSVQRLKRVLPSGVAFHHAGMLPFAKEVVEKLFSKGLIRVLFATETFAVGINMPAKSVAFSSMFKYDGFNFRYLYSKEYFQMAGRAGRRGIDDQGFVYVMFNRNEHDLPKLVSIMTADVEPIKSQYKLSFNTVLNLINNYKDEAVRERILKSSFDYYQRKKKRDIRIMSSFNNKVKTLTKFGFIENGFLTEKGIFARRIYDNEMLVSEIFSGDLYKQLSEKEIVILAASIIYEPGKNDHFERKKTRKSSKGLIHFVRKNIKHRKLLEMFNPRAVENLYRIMADYFDGAEFKDVVDLTNLEEGDVIRLFRRTIDLLRQIRHATSDYDLRDKIGLCIHNIYRVPIKVEF